VTSLDYGVNRVPGGATTRDRYLVQWLNAYRTLTPIAVFGWDSAILSLRVSSDSRSFRSGVQLALADTLAPNSNAAQFGAAYGRARADRHCWRRPDASDTITLWTAHPVRAPTLGLHLSEHAFVPRHSFDVTPQPFLGSTTRNNPERLIRRRTASSCDTRYLAMTGPVEWVRNAGQTPTRGHGPTLCKAGEVTVAQTGRTSALQAVWIAGAGRLGGHGRDHCQTADD
jgi:hypothetical protein